MTIASHHYQTWVPSSFNKFFSSLLYKKISFSYINYYKNLPKDSLFAQLIGSLKVRWWGGDGGKEAPLIIWLWISQIVPNPLLPFF